MRRSVAFTLVAGATVGVAARASEARVVRQDTADVIAEVRTASRSLDSALVRGDTAALRRTYAEAYVHIDQFGTRSNKEQRLAEFTRGVRRVQMIGPVSDESFAVSGDVVVASAQTAGQQTVNGQAQAAGRRMSTRVWIRRGGRWQVILAQVTPVTERSSRGGT